ncbi:MAG TPA: hypothetical protein DCO78_03125 [Chitinophagaceae bacterium]|nr:hypothetical protein [Chitinophagaceae bacterium]
MRYLVIFLCLAISLSACKKKDTAAPVVRVLSPSNDAGFNSGETFTIAVEVSDNELVQGFSFTRINTTNFGLNSNGIFSTEIYNSPERTVGKQIDTIRFNQTLTKSPGASLKYTYSYSFVVKDAAGNKTGESLRIILP